MSRFRTILLALAVPALLCAQALPKGDTILDRNVQASGGLKAFTPKKSVVYKGSMAIPAMGLKGPIVLTRAEPNLQLTEVELGGVGKMLEGFDGSTAWGFSAMQGPSLKEGDEKAFAAREARFHSEDWRKDYKSVETVGEDSLEGKRCYKVICTPQQGATETQFFSASSGLLLKALVKLKTAMGEIPVETLFKDYKPVGDILVAHTLTQSMAGQVVVLSFTSVEWNVAVPLDKFVPPAEVRALLKK
jgi:hypothetical protein